MHLSRKISDIIDPQKVTEITEAIDNAERIVITTHRSPDGDAIGASLALYHHLLSMGKEAVKVLVPNSFPYYLKWMDGCKDIEVFDYNPTAGHHLLHNADLIFALDYNIPKRIGAMEALFKASSATKILIDHHPFPGDDFSIVVSHPEISSTGELIFRFLWQAGRYEAITRSEAECIYCGMMSDTGGFTYNAADPEIFEIISLLLRKHIDKDEIYSRVYHNYSEGRFRMLGFTLWQRMELYWEQHAALIYLSREDQSQFQISKGDTEGFVNYPLSIKGVIFSTFIREEEGMIKLSFRSQKSFPCNAFAADFFDGGGHLNASGGEFYGTLEEALRIFREGVAAYGEKLKEAYEEA